MKNFSILKPLPVILGAVMILGIFIIKPVKGQDAPKKEKQKTIVLKVVSEKDGKTTIIDTTFTTPEEFDPDALKEMAEHMKGEMKDLQKEMEDIQVMVMTDMPDSASMDSLKKVMDKCIVIKKGPKSHCRVYAGDRPHRYEYKYNFDIPLEVEGIPLPEDFEKFYGNHGNWNFGGDFYHSRSRGETISDVIGDIPMSKVKNYSIKNTKYGKKIVIEIED